MPPARYQPVWCALGGICGKRPQNSLSTRGCQCVLRPSPTRTRRQSPTYSRSSVCGGAPSCAASPTRPRVQTPRRVTLRTRLSAARRRIPSSRIRLQAACCRPRLKRRRLCGCPRPACPERHVSRGARRQVSYGMPRPSPWSSSIVRTLENVAGADLVCVHGVHGRARILSKPIGSRPFVDRYHVNSHHPVLQIQYCSVIAHAQSV